MKKITFKDLFSEVLKSHSSGETENYFILGAPRTTPDIEKNPPVLPKPWFFSRVLGMSFIAFLGFYIGALYFQNPYFLPGLILFGSVITPISLLIFFWEVNMPKNISIYKLTLFLIKGGIVALLYSLILYTIIDGHISPLLIGFVEETAKVLTFLFLIGRKDYKYILNGMLIGAAIGTGFSAFESAGYILMTALAYGIPTMLGTIFWRAVFAPGGHIAWAALTGAALMLVKSGRPFRLSMLLDLRFLGMYALVIALHASWDVEIPQPIAFGIPVLPVVLTIASWIILYAMMKRGFKQVILASAENKQEN